jgi:hypothetical protein
MKIKHLGLTVLAAMAAFVVQPFTPDAQAAVLGGSSTCASVSFAYLNCAGSFAGNDKGASGTGLSNLESLFGSGWSFAGDSEDGLVSFVSGGDGTQVGSASTTLKGAGAIAVKAGASYSLYTVSDLAKFDWSTGGVTPVGKKGNMPGLSHLSVYRQAVVAPPDLQEVPEPAMLLGLVSVMGASTRLKRKKNEI